MSPVDPEPEQPGVLDLSMKTLCRQVPAAMLRLAGARVEPAEVQREDVTVALPEFRADQVLRVSPASGGAGWAAHFEFQGQPDSRQLRKWFLKNAGLNQQLPIPVFLIAVYLERGDRATFPDRWEQREGELVNTYVFNVVRVWEHADRIRSGDLQELAPLLILCEDSPTEQIIAEEIRRVRALPVDREVKADLLATAYMLGTRHFVRGVLNALFREELPMLKDCGIITDWIEEGEQRGELRGEQRGEQRGRTDNAREMALRVLRGRFGQVSEAWITRVNAATADECARVVDRALQVESLTELERE